MPTTIPEALRELFPRGVYKHTVDHYISEKLLGEPYSTTKLACEATLVSVSFVRSSVVLGHSLLICQLRHPTYPDTEITMSFERFAQGDGGPSSSASSGQSSASIPTSADDSFRVWTEKDRTPPKHLVKTLTFLRGAPSVVDVLAVAGLVSRRYELYSLLNHSCFFYALAIYNVLEKKFEGHSTQGAAHNSMLPIVLGLVNQYPNYFKVLLDEFDDARARLEGRIELLRLKVTVEDVLRARIAAQEDELAAKDARIAALEAAQGLVDGRIGGLAGPKDEEDA
ncbi:hypothetical protein DFH09DRAFT_1354761 [Mycena vulgaris]|nr:hypothetical protein DFH09DRAFT_1354761 [Mycena vulgaris]